MTDLPAPGPFEDPDPVLSADLPHGCIIVSPDLQEIHEGREAADVAQVTRNRRAIEIGTKADPIKPNSVDEVIDMTYEFVELGVWILATVRPDEHRTEIHAHEAVRVPDRIELAISQIARMRRQSMNIGMACYERSVREGGYIPETLLVEVRQIDENAQCIARPDQLSSLICQTGPDIRE